MSRTRLIYYPLCNSHGLINVVTVAIALPLLILILAAAVDVIRLPIIQQQIYGDAHAAYDMLFFGNESKGNNAPKELLAGKSWCILKTPNNSPYDCPSCDDFGVGVSCSGAADYAAAKIALRNAGNFLLSELSDSREMAIFRHSPEDIRVHLAVYNLLVPRRVKSNRIVGKELVAEFDSADDGGSLDYSPDFDAIVRGQFITPKNRHLGILLGDVPSDKQGATDIPIVVISVAVRVKHIFGITGKLSLGANAKKTPGHDGSVILVVNIVRPLSRLARLSAAI